MVGYHKATKKFIQSISQDKVEMPIGPVIVNPERTFSSLKTEISRKPHLFKIDCMLTLHTLFPKKFKPFHSGFGNKHTDFLTYRAVDMDPAKIFIINKKSEVTNREDLHKVSYDVLAQKCDLIYPVVGAENQQI